LDLCVLNAFLLHKSSGGKLFHKQFRVEIIHEMVQNVGMVNTRVQRGRPISSVTQLSCLEARNFSHWPVKGNKRRCVVCSQNKMRSTSSLFCRGCGVALCVFLCFEDYYTKINFI
jgi:hypothetical protein